MPARRGDRGDRVGVAEVDAGLERGQRDRAVHRAGVEDVQPERVGDPARGRDLPEPAGPSMATTPAVTRGPVTVMRSSVNSGYDTATARQPSTTDSPSIGVRGDRRRHGDAMVAVARRAATARGRRPGSTSPSARGLDPDAELASSSLDGRDAVALLHPELGGVADLGDALGERGRDREHRDLVLTIGISSPPMVVAVQRRRR